MPSREVPVDAGPVESSPRESCKSGGDSTTAFTLPWEDDDRADAKTEIFKTTCMLAVGSPEGVPFKSVLNAVFGSEWSHGGRNYLLAYRVVTDTPELLETHKPYGDLLWVRPTPEGVSLLRSMHDAGKGPAEGVESVRVEAPPRDRAKRLLSSVSRVTSDRQRGLALKLLAYHRGTMQGPDGGEKWVAVGTPGTPERGRVRVTDRFTHPERAAKPRATYERACDGLEASYDVATWVTYTVPRECVPSVYDSVAVLRDALADLHDRFRYDPADPSKPDRPGYVPPHLTVLETHRDMVAHLHVVYGGERRLMDAGDLRRDWGGVLDAPRHKPPRVHLAELRVESGEWSVVRSEGDGEGVRTHGDIRDYHRTGFRDLARLASMPHREIHERADALLAGEGTDGDRDLAGLAVPWTTEARLVTATPALAG